MSKNPKSALIEWCQERAIALPNFSVENVAGCDSFVASVSVQYPNSQQSVFHSASQHTRKKLAEKDAAEVALENLQKLEPPRTVNERICSLITLNMDDLFKVTSEDDIDFFKFKEIVYDVLSNYHGEISLEFLLLFSRMSSTMNSAFPNGREATLYQCIAMLRAAVSSECLELPTGVRKLCMRTTDSAGQVESRIVLERFQLSPTQEAVYGRQQRAVSRVPMRAPQHSLTVLFLPCDDDVSSENSCSSNCLSGCVEVTLTAPAVTSNYTFFTKIRTELLKTAEMTCTSSLYTTNALKTMFDGEIDKNCEVRIFATSDSAAEGRSEANYSSEENASNSNSNSSCRDDVSVKRVFPFNPIASWLACTPVYGNAVLAGISLFSVTDLKLRHLAKLLQYSLPSGMWLSKQICNNNDDNSNSNDISSEEFLRDAILSPSALFRLPTKFIPEMWYNNSRCEGSDSNSCMIEETVAVGATVSAVTAPSQLAKSSSPVIILTEILRKRTSIFDQSELFVESEAFSHWVPCSCAVGTESGTSSAGGSSSVPPRPCKQRHNSKNSEQVPRCKFWSDSVDCNETDSSNSKQSGADADFETVQCLLCDDQLGYFESAKILTLTLPNCSASLFGAANLSFSSAFPTETTMESVDSNAINDDCNDLNDNITNNNMASNLSNVMSPHPTIQCGDSIDAADAQARTALRALHEIEKVGRQLLNIPVEGTVNFDASLGESNNPRFVSFYAQLFSNSIKSTSNSNSNNNSSEDSHSDNSATENNIAISSGVLCGYIDAGLLPTALETQLNRLEINQSSTIECSIEETISPVQYWLWKHVLKLPLVVNTFPLKLDVTLLSSVMLNDKKVGGPKKSAQHVFVPSLAIQRKNLVCKLMRESHAECWVDIGCGNCCLMKRILLELLNNDVNQKLQLQHVVGIDINELRLNEARKSLEECSKFLTIDLQNFSIVPNSVSEDEQAVEKPQGEANAEVDAEPLCDVMTCIEVIEHLPSESVAFATTIHMLRKLRPRFALISTPNYESNALIRTACDKRSTMPRSDSTSVAGPGSISTGEAYRELDHKFEWTRTQFQTYVNHIISEAKHAPWCLHYEADIVEIGCALPGMESTGGATQAVVLKRINTKHSKSSKKSDLNELFKKRA